MSSYFLMYPKRFKLLIKSVFEIDVLSLIYGIPHTQFEKGSAVV